MQEDRGFSRQGVGDVKARSEVKPVTQLSPEAEFELRALRIGAIQKIFRNESLARVDVGQLIDREKRDDSQSEVQRLRQQMQMVMHSFRFRSMMVRRLPILWLK